VFLWRMSKLLLNAVIGRQHRGNCNGKKPCEGQNSGEGAAEFRYCRNFTQ